MPAAAAAASMPITVTAIGAALLLPAFSFILSKSAVSIPSSGLGGPTCRTGPTRSGFSVGLGVAVASGLDVAFAVEDGLTVARGTALDRFAAPGVAVAFADEELLLEELDLFDALLELFADFELFDELLDEFDLFDELLDEFDLFEVPFEPPVLAVLPDAAAEIPRLSELVKSKNSALPPFSLKRLTNAHIA